MVIVPKLVLMLSAADCCPPHAVTDPPRLVWLKENLLRDGWVGPYLLGYPLDGYVQLVSGSHRYEACMQLGMKFPVAVASKNTIELIWGTDEWVDMMTTPPLYEAETWGTSHRIN